MAEAGPDAGFEGRYLDPEALFKRLWARPVGVFVLFALCLLLGGDSSKDALHQREIFAQRSKQHAGPSPISRWLYDHTPRAFSTVIEKFPSHDPWSILSEYQSQSEAFAYIRTLGFGLRTQVLADAFFDGDPLRYLGAAYHVTPGAASFAHMPSSIDKDRFTSLEGISWRPEQREKVLATIWNALSDRQSRHYREFIAQALIHGFLEANASLTARREISHGVLLRRCSDIVAENPVLKGEGPNDRAAQTELACLLMECALAWQVYGAPAGTRENEKQGFPVTLHLLEHGEPTLIQALCVCEAFRHNESADGARVRALLIPACLRASRSAEAREVRNFGLWLLLSDGGFLNIPVRTHSTSLWFKQIRRLTPRHTFIVRRLRAQSDWSDQWVQSHAEAPDENHFSTEFYWLLSQGELPTTILAELDAWALEQCEDLIGFAKLHYPTQLAR